MGGERVINGLAGFQEVEDTALHAKSGGDYWENILILEDAKFEIFTGGKVTGFGADAVAGNARVYLAGDTFFGRITRFKLHSGRVRAYHRSN